MIARTQRRQDADLTCHAEWRVPPAWLERARDDAVREHAVARTGAASTLGTMALDAIRRPWRFVSVVKAVRAAVWPRRPFDAPVRPTPRDRAASPADVDQTLALQEEIGALRAEIATIAERSATQLGRRLLRLRRRPWRLALVPLVVLDHLRRARETVVATSRPAPCGKASDATARPPSADPTAAARRWSCFAPPWLAEMLAFDGVPTLSPGDVPPDALLVCVGGQADPTLRSLAEWRGPAGRTSPTCPVVFWLLDGAHQDTWASVVRTGDRIYVGDRGRVDEVAARVAQPVAHLPLGVQPLLHNPIEWWHGRRGIAGEHEAAADVPAILRTLIDVARGRDVDDRALRALEAQLESPLETATPPAWADRALRRDLVRQARLRGVLGGETLATRLARIADDLGLAASADTTPLVSVAIVTTRPHRVAAILRAYVTQTYARKELVVVLHGRHFTQRDVDTIVATEPAARVHRAPEHWSVGESRQLACDESAGHLICFMDDDNHYGPRYVEQHALAMRFSEAGLVGKASHVIRFDHLDRMYLFNPGHEYHYMKISGAGRLGLRREVVDQVRWRPMPILEDVAFIDDCEALGIPMLSLDRFHFVRVRGNPSQHTAPTTAARFFADEHFRIEPLSPAATVEGLDA